MTQPQGGYPVGNTRTVFVDFVDEFGAPADSTTTTLYVRSPLGVTTRFIFGSSTIVKPAGTLGRYEYDVVLNASGRWGTRWEGVVNGKTVTSENFIDCAKSRVRPELP